jgi:hypothetical protein
MVLTRLKRLPSPSIVISVIALIVAVGGGSFAIAALTHHDKKVVKQISNQQITKRAKKLSVKRAKTADSATTAASATSAANATGLSGPLASGQTLIGYVNTTGHSAAGEIAPEATISFPIPLATAPAVHIIPVGGPPTSDCPGTDANPSATGGSLCIYESVIVGATGMAVPAGLHPVTVTRFGLPGLLASGTNGDYIARAAWAVTAP